MGHVPLICQKYFPSNSIFTFPAGEVTSMGKVSYELNGGHFILMETLMKELSYTVSTGLRQAADCVDCCCAQPAPGVPFVPGRLYLDLPGRLRRKVAQIES
jgi:hypothetical protein